MTDVDIARISLAQSLAAITAAETELGRLDSFAGDGDHGAGMVRGFTAATAAMGDGTSVADVLKRAGMAFADAAGGASGALVGMLLQTIGQNLPEGPIDASTLHKAIESGIAAIGKLGKAKVGDKTMLDTLEPFVK